MGGVCREVHCEGVVCPEGQTCYRGACYRSCQGEGAGSTSLSGCTEEERCYQGHCARLDCEDVACRDGEVCYRGACYPRCQSDASCTQTQSLCTEGGCVDPCEEVVCPREQMCYRGACYASCQVQEDCALQTRCAQDVCLPRSCEGVRCREDEACYQGACYAACRPDGSCSEPRAACRQGLCEVASCEDGLPNQDETGVDCGGGLCPPCADEQVCLQARDCQSGVCQGGLCQRPACADGAQNGAETGVDCGGPSCGPCTEGQPCQNPGDCFSGACRDNVCQGPTCVDGVPNGQETGVDCGGPACQACSDGQGCLFNADCLGEQCLAGVCASPGCSDGVRNGEETGEDCGGLECGGCAAGQGCQLVGDCQSGVCQGALCQEASCTDGVQNASETDVDCGGPACAACAVGQGCAGREDCPLRTAQAWSSCNYDSFCDALGTQVREVLDYTCNAALRCAPQGGTESRACARSTEGEVCSDDNPCAPGTCQNQNCVLQPICQGTSASCGCTTCANCAASDGWVDMGASYACCRVDIRQGAQDGSSACSTCQDQELRAFSCSGTSCTYTVTATRTNTSGCSACDDGNACRDGSCPCLGVVCEGQCIDPQTDKNHCGSCANACGVGQVCAGATCSPFALIPAGIFVQGPDENGTSRPVTISRPFYLQATEVTQGQWKALMGTEPWAFRSCGEDCPVEQVSWHDALAYMNALSANEGLPACYALSDCSGTPGVDLNCGAVTFGGLSCPGYRLPTEAEWEYAARGGMPTETYAGNLPGMDCPSSLFVLGAIAWYSCNSDSTPQRVAQKGANAYGLYDMLGNVWEWNWDLVAPYAIGSVTDPLGPPTGSVRVGRGGGWALSAEGLMVSYRYYNLPDYRYDSLGFRPARSVP